MKVDVTRYERMPEGKKVFEETFRSGFPKKTKEDAMKVLEGIREVHCSNRGWHEEYAFLEETSEGWVAVRRHAKYN